MEDADREAAFLAALNNEYFVLQSAASTTVSESGTRASLYVFSLSSTLIALGFVSQSETAFMPFLSVVLPTLFVLGVLTTVRLVDTGIQNVAHLRGMARIRRYWAELTPQASEFFGTAASRSMCISTSATFAWPGTRRRSLGVRRVPIRGQVPEAVDTSVQGDHEHEPDPSPAVDVVTVIDE